MLQPLLHKFALATRAMVAPFLADLTLSRAFAADEAVLIGGTTGAQSVRVGLSKSVIIDLPRDARDILVSNPVIADAVIRTPRRIYVTGVAVGQSNVIVFDRAGRLRRHYFGGRKASLARMRYCATRRAFSPPVPCIEH